MPLLWASCPLLSIVLPNNFHVPDQHPTGGGGLSNFLTGSRGSLGTKPYYSITQYMFHYICGHYPNNIKGHQSLTLVKASQGRATSFSRDQEGGPVTFTGADKFHPAPVLRK